VATKAQVLEIEYGSARDFSEDYRANLSNGGVFIATERSFALRDFVVVRLRMPWCSRVIDLEGEIVHIVSADMASIGVKPGVAVQFREPPAGIRGRLGPLCAGAAPAPAPSPDESRIAPRRSVRVAAHLESATARSAAARATSRRAACSSTCRRARRRSASACA
jgi:Tfp pilus assembly protein PilZ